MATNTASRVAPAWPRSHSSIAWSCGIEAGASTQPASTRNNTVVTINPALTSRRRARTWRAVPGPGSGPPARIALLDVGVDQRHELAGDVLAPQRELLLAVHEHRRRRCLAGARQRDADVGVARLAWPVDHAAHHRKGEVLRARMGDAPLRHLRAHVPLDCLGKFLEQAA